MPGQKRNQASGYTVRNNLAHSFNFKADTSVKAERNSVITPVMFAERLAALTAEIDRRFGPIHPVAKSPRLEPPVAR